MSLFEVFKAGRQLQVMWPYTTIIPQSPFSEQFNSTTCTVYTCEKRTQTTILVEMSLRCPCDDLDKVKQSIHWPSSDAGTAEWTADV